MTLAVFRKELKVMWASPFPYVLGALFHATLGVLGWAQIVGRGQAVFQPIVPLAGFLILLVAPPLASRSFAEEIRSGTLELLLAIPVARIRLVVGKYLAILVTLVAMIAPVALFAALLEMFGDPDTGPIISGLAGLLLLGAALGAIGLAASSLTSSQPVAAIGGLFAVLVLWFAHTGSEALAVGSFLASFSISERLRSFAGGLVDLSDLVFFITIVAVALAVAVFATESRRWR